MQYSRIILVHCMQSEHINFTTRSKEHHHIKMHQTWCCSFCCNVVEPKLQFTMLFFTHLKRTPFHLCSCSIWIFRSIYSHHISCFIGLWMQYNFNKTDKHSSACLICSLERINNELKSVWRMMKTNLCKINI